MKKPLLARRPSPALAIACTALFVSLGGVAHGVATGFIDSREIRNNTIRTQDLRNNDIRAIDIRNSTIRSRDVALNALTGSDINESKLEEVPSAGRAGDASKLAGVEASDYVRRSGAVTFTALAPASDWQAVPDRQSPGYFVDPLGFVHLRGNVQRVAGSAELALSLPATARPAAAKRLPVYGETPDGAAGVAGIRIDPDGSVLVRAAPEVVGTLISLDGVIYHPRS